MANPGMDFGGALHCMKGGDKCFRQGWAGGVYVNLQKPDDHSKMTEPYLYEIRGEMDGECVPWTPTQADMLAEDWVMMGENG
jgi:hypothetical protein